MVSNFVDFDLLQLSELLLTLTFLSSTAFQVSPFAGNLLALGSIYQKWSDIDFFQKMVTLFCSLLMVIPTILFSLCWVLWICLRNAVYMLRFPVGVMYLSQSADNTQSPRESWVKASLVDMVSVYLVFEEPNFRNLQYVHHINVSSSSWHVSTQH